VITPTTGERLLRAARHAEEALCEIEQAQIPDSENADLAFARAQLQNAQRCLRDALDTYEHGQTSAIAYAAGGPAITPGSVTVR